MNDLVNALLAGWQLNLDLAEALLQDIPADQATDQPGGVVNHPAWTLSHLNHYHPAILALIHNQPVEDPGRHPDAPKYDEGSTPVNDPALYPDWADLLATYRDGHERVADALSAMNPEHLARPPRLERWAAAFGATAGILQYLLIIHEAQHVGQLMVWRRAAGLAKD
jgi:uncharacterized damage-inducible protein DinB